MAERLIVRAVPMGRQADELDKQLDEAYETPERYRALLDGEEPIARLFGGATILEEDT
jgi:hypothetical protein